MLVFSKCIAGGFSAALVLLWWPQLVPGASLSAWLGRGVAFTLSFEILLLALRPLEETLWGTRSGSRVRDRVHLVRERLRGGNTTRRLGSSLAIAAVALTLPGLLIADGLSRQSILKPHRAARAVKVVRVTRVVRPVTVQRVVAEKEVPVPVPAAPVVSSAAPKAKPKPATKSSPPAKVKAPAKQRAPAKETQQTTQEKSSSGAPKAQANGSSLKRDRVQTSLPS